MRTQTKNISNKIRSQGGLTDTTRAFEWWEFKLSPLFATVYATAVLLQVSVFSLWKLLILLLVAVTVGGAYVSIINDWSDAKDDAASGKRNRLVEKSLHFKIIILLCCLLPGLAITIFFSRYDLLSTALYLSAWISYALYSLQPFRFKNRGFLGVLADAGGAHLFPQLFVVSAISHWVGQSVNWKWFAIVGVWSLAWGLRGILWHQVLDASNDVRANVNTFVHKHSKATACWLGEKIIFRIELLALAAIIIILGSYLSAMFLVLYFALVWSRTVLWEMNIVIVAPQRQYFILMNEYYEVFYPLAFLLAAAFLNPFDIIILLIHFLIFPCRIASLAREIFLAIVELVKHYKKYKESNIAAFDE